jgi:hypothetical protein
MSAEGRITAAILGCEFESFRAENPSPAHARLGPSGADRWMVCHGAPNAEDGLPNDSSEFAAEGTAAHEVSDLCLSLGFEPYEFVGQTYQIDGFTIDFDDDMADALQPGIDWTREQPGTFYGECKVDLSEWLGEGQFGTSDRFIVAPDMLTVADLKFGRGVPVSPVDNKQAMLYALGAWRRFASHITDPAFPVRIVIDQPRCTGGGGEWMTTLGRLLEFGEEARAAARLTLDPNAPRVASAKGCMWCRRRTAPGGCYAFDEHNLDLLGQKFEDLDDGPIELPRALTRNAGLSCC